MKRAWAIIGVLSFYGLLICVVGFTWMQHWFFGLLITLSTLFLLAYMHTDKENKEPENRKEHP